MRKLVFTFGLCCLFLFTVAGFAQTPDGETPSQETICDGETGAAFGLCNAYCEAMDCHLENPQASSTACTKVGDRFERITGRRPPCDITCPCFTSADLQEGTIVECGENFPGFPDLAGVFYSDGRLGCSGFLCATNVGRSCALIRISGELVTVFDLTEEVDNNCRTLILQNCANPNAPTASASPPSAAPFVNQ